MKWMTWQMQLLRMLRHFTKSSTHPGMQHWSFQEISIKKRSKALVKKYFEEIPGGEALEQQGTNACFASFNCKTVSRRQFCKSSPSYNDISLQLKAFRKMHMLLIFWQIFFQMVKKHPLYKVLVKDKKLTSQARAMNMSLELTGAFRLQLPPIPG